MIPYYVGKGSGRRAYTKRDKKVPVPPDARICIQHWASENEAFEMEKWWIALFGCKYDHSGCLENQGEGGRGVPKRACARGGRTNAESGHLARIASSGGRKNIEKHGSFGTVEGSRKAGLMAVESKSGIFAPEMYGVGGRIGGRIGGKTCAEKLVGVCNPEIRARGVHKGGHVTNHVKRGIVKPNCTFCMEALKNEQNQ
jgi:hypothetical protein